MKTGKSQIAIIGSGFGGIGLAIQLRKTGIEDFTIYERAGDIGGVWRDNTYPGAACDVPSQFYSYSFEQGYPWSGRFGSQAEIWDYLKYCADKYDITRHIRFSQDIRSAAFDATECAWTLETAAGERIDADILVSAVGLFNRPLLPALPGRETFAGPQFHSSSWDHDCVLEDRTVAVIGTGASAIQFVPAIAPRVKDLLVFQRSAQYVMPRADEVLADRWGPFAPLANRLDRFKLYVSFEKRGRNRWSDQKTADGRAAFLAGLEKRVSDPDLRRRLIPDYPLGCKRVLQSNDWYPALQRPNVTLIDAPVAEMTPDGPRTGDGRSFAADVVIYGTGFTPTQYLTPIRVTGLDGRELNAEWRGGAEAYYGMAVSGFPNFFMMYGPNTNISGSIIYMLECQAHYITDAVRALGRGRARRMTVRADVQRRFNEKMQGELSKSVMAADTCHSYFRDPSGKVTTQWPGFMMQYRRRTRRVRKADFDFA